MYGTKKQDHGGRNLASGSVGSLYIVEKERRVIIPC